MNRASHPHTIKSLWPIFLTYTFISLIYSAIFINMINIAEGMIWKGTNAYQNNIVKMGMIISIRSLMWALSGLLFGNLADRISRKKLFIIAAAIIGVSCIFFSWAPRRSGNVLFYYFMIANAFSGIGLGGIYPIITSYTKDYLGDDKVGKFFGTYSTLNLIVMNIGMIISAWSFKIGLLRTFFGTTGILILSSLILIFFFIREPQRAHFSSKKLAHALSKMNYSYEFTMTKKTFRKTILSKSNLLMILEGIFTCILFEVVLFLIIPYLENPPLNVDESSISVIFVIFAAPGAILSATFLAHKSDQWGSKNIKNRVSILILSVSISVVCLYLAFVVPLEPMTMSQCQNLIYLLTQPKLWIIGLFITLMLGARVLYLSNQPPVIQAINLPETQGFVSSVNQFLEILASAIGPMFGAAVLAVTSFNYKLTAILCGIIGIPGVICWILTRFVISKDIEGVQAILSERANEIISNGESMKNNQENSIEKNSIEID